MPGARDGQMRVNRGADDPPWSLQMYDDDLGLWLTLAQADVEEDEMRAGIPILRGPYVVNFGDILHHGDSKVLWTPEVGDVLLRLFVDWQTVTQWATGQFLGIGQNVDVTVNPATNVIAYADSGTIGHGPGEGLDSILDAVGTDATDNAGAGWYSTAYVFNSAVPMRVMYGCLGGTTDATQGHVELYAVVARAVAP